MPELQKGLSEVVNKHIAAVGPSGIREFDQKISSIDGIVKLTLGEPDFNVPEHVKQAAIDSIKANKSHYSASRGIIELRQAISRYLKTKTNVDYDPNTEIVVTMGD